MADRSYLTPEITAVIKTSLTGQPDHVERNDIAAFAEAIRYPKPPYPLYTDEIFARSTRYGGLIAPPTYFTRLARRNGYPWSAPLPQWLAERPGLSAGAVIERAEPLRPGDTIFTHGVVTDIYERDGDQGKLFFVVRDFEFTNQLGQSVGKLRRINIRFPESLPYDRSESSRVEALKDCRDSKRGEEISPCSTQVSLMELNRFAGANREWGRYHMDRDFARSLALDDVLVIETLKMAYVANMLEDYFGENSWIQTLAIDYPTMDFIGDTLICHGQIVKQTVRDGQKHTECDVWIENQRGKVGTIGSAVVRLLD